MDMIASIIKIKCRVLLDEDENVQESSTTEPINDMDNDLSAADAPMMTTVYNIVASISMFL